MTYTAYIRKLKSLPCAHCGVTIIAKRSNAICPACRLLSHRKAATKARLANPEYYKSRDKERQINPTPERSAYIKSYLQDYAPKHRAANKAMYVMYDANRRAAEKQAKPAWANDFFIEEAYRLAKLREKVCGGKWHVDHKIPLKHDLVCGLHVENNLQVIPASMNMSKGNKFVIT